MHRRHPLCELLPLVHKDGTVATSDDAFSWTVVPLTARHGADYQKWLVARRHRIGQRSVRGIVGEILPAGEEPQKGAALVRGVVSNRPSQHGITNLERVEDRALSGLTLDIELHFAVDVGKRSKVHRKHDSNHDSVCTSTDSTAGKSRTMGVQLSPASVDAYTCPPVVPK